MGWHQGGGSEEEQGRVEGANWWRQLGINWKEASMTKGRALRRGRRKGPRGGSLSIT